MENLTEKLMLVLRDGRKLIGVLRSWDQFGTLSAPRHSTSYFLLLLLFLLLTLVARLPANLVLTSTTERYFVSSSSEERLFADIPRGTYLVRGENVLLIGEIDLDKDDDPPPGYTEAAIADVFALKKEEEARRKKTDKKRSRLAGELWGGEVEGSGEILL